MTRREGGVQCVMGGGVKNIFFTPCMAVMCAIDFVACARPAILSLHVLKTFAKLLHTIPLFVFARTRNWKIIC